MEHSINQTKIIDKIKKCLALSKSSNQYEAAAALRQAHKLMRQYKLSQKDIDLHGVNEQISIGSGNHQPPEYECYLAGHIGYLFNCKVLHDPDLNHWVFIGVRPHNELAQYAFNVLYRQLKKNRTEYIKSRLHRCKTRATKTRRADLYCDAWVNAVYQTIKKFAIQNTNELNLINRYIEEKYPDTYAIDRIQRNQGLRLNESDWRSYHAGEHDGAQVNIDQGVGRDMGQKMIG